MPAAIAEAEYENICKVCGRALGDNTDWILRDAGSGPAEYNENIDYDDFKENHERAIGVCGICNGTKLYKKITSTWGINDAANLIVLKKLSEGDKLFESDDSVEAVVSGLGAVMSDIRDIERELEREL